MVKHSKKIVGIIGSNADKCTDEIYAFGLELGQKLNGHHFFIVCVGPLRVMEAVCIGAHHSDSYQ